MSNYEHLERKILLDEETALLAQERISRIDAFSFHWLADREKHEPARLRELKQLSTCASVGSSTRIEGSELSNAEVAGLVEKMEINQLKTRDQEEVLGYYDALNMVWESYDAIALTESHIKQLHGVLLKYSSKDTRHKGDYKNLTNKVVAKYPDGTSRVVFNTTEPHLTAKEMSELVAWTDEKFSDTNFHKLLVTAVFIYEFLSIHPFQDGNGRLSRILTNLLLMRAGYDFVQYISLESIIEERKKFYYQYLMHGQQHRYSEKEDIDLWMVFFLDVIELAIERLKNNTVSIERLIDTKLNDRQNAILKFALRHASFRMSDLVDEFQDVSRASLSLDLVILVEAAKLSRHGQGRGTWYQAR